MALLQRYQQLTLRLVRPVSSPHRVHRTVKKVLAPLPVQRAFVAALRLAAERGLTAGSLSEFSQRLPAERLLMATAEVLTSERPEDHLLVLTLDPDAEPDPVTAPRHVSWHRAIYRSTRSQATALCQPAASTAIASRPDSLQAALLQDAHDAVGGILWVEPQEKRIAEGAGQAGALLIRGHGLLTHGANLAHAITRAEIVNRWCEIALAARRLTGTPSSGEG